MSKSLSWIMKASPFLSVTLCHRLSPSLTLSHPLSVFLSGFSSLCHNVSLLPVPSLPSLLITPCHSLWLCGSHYCHFSSLCSLYSSGLFAAAAGGGGSCVALIRTNCHLMSVLLSGVRVCVCVWVVVKTQDEGECYVPKREADVHGLKS